MGIRWTAFPPGEPPPGGDAFAALSLPAELLYYKRISIPRGAALQAGSVLAYASGAIDPELPVPVEDCIVYAAPCEDGAIAAFAVERKRLLEAVGTDWKADCIVPEPMAIWRKASMTASGGAGEALLHIHAHQGRIVMVAGRRAPAGKLYAPAVVAVAEDALSAARTARIWTSRLAANVGREASVCLSFGGAVVPDLAEAIKKALGGTGFVEAPRMDLPPVGQMAAEYAAERILRCDSEPQEVESGRLIALRRRRASAPAVILLAGLAVWAVAACFGFVASARALAESDDALGRIADALAGYPQGLKGRAAVPSAVNAFNGRLDPNVERFASGLPRDAIQTVFAFATARSMRVAAMSLSDKALFVDVAAEVPQDFDALLSALASLGYSAKATPLAAEEGVDPDSMRIEIERPEVE